MLVGPQEQPQDGNQEASSLQFVTQVGRKISVEHVEWDGDLDIAVLHLGEDVPEGLVVGRAIEGAVWQVETQPLGNDPKLTGTVTATQRQFVKGKGRPAIYVVQLQVDQNLGEYKGYSGSPVALQSASGAVIGVLVEQLLSRLSGPIGQPRSATNVLYAIPIQDVLNRFGIAYKLIEPPIQEPLQLARKAHQWTPEDARIRLQVEASPEILRQFPLTSEIYEAWESGQEKPPLAWRKQYKQR